MVVKSIFEEVDYPSDKKSLEHMIKEYDKRLEYKIGLPISKKPNYLFHIFSIINLFYIIKCSSISIFIRLLYMMPLFLSVIYSIILFNKAKKDNYNDEKLFYKLINFDIIHIFIYIYSGIFMYETVVFRKWTSQEYLMSFMILIILATLSSIIARIEAPKRFLNNYKNNKRELFTAYSAIIPIVQVLVGVTYFNRPYYLLLIASSIFVVVISGVMTYILFIYNQYDKIQELKKEINYIHKERKK